MIRDLLLRNIVLIDEVSLSFEKGLTILSGETGAGKTALIEALGWLLGERIDSAKVRDSTQKALVQATFVDARLPELLSPYDIELEPNEPVIIQREITPSGKSRALIQNQLVPLQTLQAIAPFLIEIIGQHAHHSLRTREAHRDFVDLFAGIAPLLAQFNEKWEQEKAAHTTLEILKQKKERATLQLPLFESQLAELTAAAIATGEETALFAQYQSLSHAQENLDKSQQIQDVIGQSESALLSTQTRLQQLALLDKTVGECPRLLNEACVQLREISYSLSCFQGHLESEPHQLSQLEERLTLIDKMKKRFGKTADELPLLEEQLKNEIDGLALIDDQLLENEERLKKLQVETTQFARQISSRRKEVALQLEIALTDALRGLNMPHAEMQIHVETTPGSRFGEDAIAFFLRANRGEKFTAVTEGTSGGELSRLYLSMILLLAEKNRPATLIFDEIDANVGGQTAALIGRKLHELAQHRQVLCITHFPQVAACGDQQLRLFKEELSERTLTRIEALSADARERELARMRGD